VVISSSPPGIISPFVKAKFWRGPREHHRPSSIVHRPSLPAALTRKRLLDGRRWCRHVRDAAARTPHRARFVDYPRQRQEQQGERVMTVARRHRFGIESIPLPRLAAFAAAIAAAIGGSPRVLLAQAGDQSVALVVQAGRPLRVALDERIRLTRIGQPIAGTLVEPVYAYDRIVIPVGTPVLGHVDKLENGSKGARVRAILSGDFSPLRRAVLQFDTIVSSDGYFQI